MKKSKTCLIFFARAVLLLFCLAGCKVDDDISTGEITIFNIPKDIPVRGKDDISSPTFKIYVNASDSQSEFEPSVARGLALISDAKLDSSTNTYTITIRLMEPSPEDNMNPDIPTPAWSGTAKYFSVMITPQSVKDDGENAVWIRGGYSFDRGRANYDWTNLINFRARLASELELDKKASALYRDIILNDSMIEK